MRIALAVLCLWGGIDVVQGAAYWVAIPRRTADDPGWSAVADVLVERHAARRVVWNGRAEDLLPLLRQGHPEWLAVVGKPEDFDAAFVRALNRVTRKIDPDPWEDVRWGLITAPTPAYARRVAATCRPLIIERALNTTGIDMSLVRSGLTLSDAKKGVWSEKLPDGRTVRGEWDPRTEPGGTVERFARYWRKRNPQLLVTSSHATQFNLEMPFGLGLIVSHAGKFHVLTRRQRNDFARFLNGALFRGGEAELGNWIERLHAPTLADASERPKVWVAAGNCLIGDARRTTNSMVVTALGPGGCRQFVGYVVPTWYGRNGWGTLRLWTSQRGELSLADAFHLNRQRLIADLRRRFPEALAIDYDGDDLQHCLRTRNAFTEGLARLRRQGVKLEKDLLGLIHDRDVVAFWGDPKWVATFRPAKPRPVTISFTETEPGTLRLVIQAKEEKFSGPVLRYLPRRLPGVQATLADGSPLPGNATVADDFIILPRVTLEAGERMVVQLRAP